MTKTISIKKRIPLALILTGMIMTMLGSALAQQDSIQTKPGPVSAGKPTEQVMTQAGSTTMDLRKLPQAPPRKRERPEREAPEIKPTELKGSPPSPVSSSSLPLWFLQYGYLLR